MPTTAATSETSTTRRGEADGEEPRDAGGGEQHRERQRRDPDARVDRRKAEGDRQVQRDHEEQPHHHHELEEEHHEAAGHLAIGEQRRGDEWFLAGPIEASHVQHEQPDRDEARRGSSRSPATCRGSRARRRPAAASPTREDCSTPRIASPMPSAQSAEPAGRDVGAPRPAGRPCGGRRARCRPPRAPRRRTPIAMTRRSSRARRSAVRRRSRWRRPLPRARTRAGAPAGRSCSRPSATIAGMMRAAPTPSRNDQPKSSTPRFGASAVVSEPEQ